MINHVYRLISPHFFSVSFINLNLNSGVIVRPKHMSICQADQRYYLGLRTADVLKKKLPMALIHESSGEVVYDPSNTFKIGQPVIMVPNIPGDGPSYLYENYLNGSRFMSSGIDGFMQEFVSMPPDRLVPFNNIVFPVSSICELVSVGTHAVFRFGKNAHERKQRIGIWGDGSVAYIISCILKEKFPDCKIIVMGKDRRKLAYFSFVHETYLKSDLPKNFSVDHAFECAGGEGSYFAIDDIIRHIEPQGSVVLLGVSENKVAINTRDILEKGLNFVGCSRSGRVDFEEAVKLLETEKFQTRIRSIVQEETPVYSIEDIHRVFKKDRENLFKTVFEWRV